MSVEGLIGQVANHICDHLSGQAVWTPPAGLFVKLHIGPPGIAGTANPAAEITRPAAVFHPAAGGMMTLDTPFPQWLIAADETLTHISMWDMAVAGAAQWSGVMATPVPVTSGQTFELSVCQLIFTIAGS